MCGIVGYIGDNAAVPYLLEGLKKLEYRGYDSAGIALAANGNIEVIKSSGRIKKLEEKLSQFLLPDSHCAIGHTRWATHGAPNDTNAHPHVSQTGLFCVVHNGIIENYEKLRHKLEHDGFIFKSETDTEVIAHLLEQTYCGDSVSALSKTAAQLEGSFALAILCRDEPDKILCTKRSSPLVLGESKDGSFVASDVTAMLRHTKDVYTLSDGEIAVVKRDGIDFYDNGGGEIKKKKEYVSWNDTDAEKGGYEHFMMKEIAQQPDAINETVKPRIKDSNVHFEKLNISDSELLQITRIYFVACGSAYHVGLCGKYLTERLTQIPCEAQVASEFRYMSPVLSETSLVVIISQSGETADTLAALRLAKEKNAKVISVVNVVGSSIAKESDSVIYTYAGPEIAVATTKAYSTQLCCVYLLSAYIAKVKHLINEAETESLTAEILKLPQKIEFCLQKQDEIKELSKVFKNKSHAFFIGRNIDYPSACEAALKMKEISYIPCEAYAAGELKHGTISLIEKDSVVVAICCCDDVFQKTVSNIKEVKARGAYIIAVTTEKHKDDLADADSVITVPDSFWCVLPSVEVIPMQLLSYYTAKEKGCDIDKPQNLAKSVTVE